MTATARAPIAGTRRLPLMAAVGLIAGAVIALQIAIMRVFAVGSWAHFGSMVVSLAMLGFGLASVVLCIAKDWFDRHWRGAAGTSVFLFGPLTVAANLAAQQLPFNPIFIVSDPSQKWRLAANFLLYLVPFLSGAFFLGIVFLKAREAFGRVYFADLSGSGIAGLLILAAMYVFPPESLIAVPLLLSALGGALWLAATDAWRSAWALVALAALSLAGYAALPGLLGVPQIAVSQYKGVAYARNFPDAQRVYRSISPLAICRSMPRPTCTSRRGFPTTPPSTCPRSRPTPMSASMSTARGRKASCAARSPTRPTISATCPWSIPTWSRRSRRPSSSSSAAASRPWWR
jgi:hypothetical protein